MPGDHYEVLDFVVCETHKIIYNICSLCSPVLPVQRIPAPPQEQQHFPPFLSHLF